LEGAEPSIQYCFKLKLVDECGESAFLTSCSNPSICEFSSELDTSLDLINEVDYSGVYFSYITCAHLNWGQHHTVNLSDIDCTYDILITFGNGQEKRYEAIEP
jgi:hypothetical protein